MSAADHANTVRGVLRRSVWTTEMADNANAAVDALQAQAEGAVVAIRKSKEMREAAEAERDRLAERVEQLETALLQVAEMDFGPEFAGRIRAALAGEDKP